MSKWLNQFLENEIVNRSDKSDRFEKGVNLSGLSGRPQGLFDGKRKKVENNLRKGGDKSDRFRFETNMSPLSLRPPGLLDENLEKVKNNPSKGGDKSDRFRFETNMSPLSLRTPGLFPLDRDSLLYGFEERLAIAEYDGLQNPCQAERIAYLDAFMAVLATLSDEGLEGDWLDHKIVEAKKWLLDQGLSQAK